MPTGFIGTKTTYNLSIFWGKICIYLLAGGVGVAVGDLLNPNRGAKRRGRFPERSYLKPNPGLVWTTLTFLGF